jgi:hypothetical protein
MSAELERSRRLIHSYEKEKLAETILEVLPQGHGSGLDADLLDGLHAAEILAKMRVSGGGGGGGGGVSDHGALTGLDDPADHMWAFLLDGSRAFTGNLLPSVSGSFNLGSALKKIGTGFIEVVRTSIVQVDGGNLLITPTEVGAEIWIKAWDSIMGPISVARAKLGYFEILYGGDISLVDDKFLKVGKDSDGALPAASATYRGKLIRVEGGEGVADKTYQCMKAADESYSWKEVVSG